MSFGKRITWLNEIKRAKEISEWELPKAKNIILFDMDGTLTPPRQSFDMNLLQPLRNLSEVADIGIVSGSDFDYIKEQMNFLITKSEIRFKLHLMPCNGTKYYSPPTYSSDEYRLTHEVNMKTHLGDKSFYHLMRILTSLQYHISELGIPLSGNFIQYRGSMINWCPIGRKASLLEREAFVDYDNDRNIREDYLKRLKRKLSLHGLDKKIVCTLGGETSFDIYPKGWDKTYALQHFDNQDVWFVGDRCEDGGNDQILYEALINKGRSYKTKGPENTKEIIEAINQHLLSVEDK